MERNLRDWVSCWDTAADLSKLDEVSARMGHTCARAWVREAGCARGEHTSGMQRAAADVDRLRTG